MLLPVLAPDAFPDEFAGLAPHPVMAVSMSVAVAHIDRKDLVTNDGPFLWQFHCLYTYIINIKLNVRNYLYEPL